jgi:hypothetical protein
MIESKSRPVKWPPRCSIRIYDGPPDDPVYVEERNDRLLDLFDAVMLHWGPDERIVYLGLYTDSKQWKIWDDKTLRHIERIIHDDMAFDRCAVQIERISGEGEPCDQEALWRLVINQSST